MVILVVAAFVAGYLIGRARPPAVMASEDVHMERTMAVDEGDARVGLPAMPDSRERA